MFCDEQSGSTVLPAAGVGRPASPVHGSPSLVVRAALDRGVALLALVLLVPLLLAIALVIRCTSHGPALVRQARVGLDGRTFAMLKFRSMYYGTERRLVELLAADKSAGGLLFTMRDDPRVTPIGRVLRRFSLDELPQLLNVLTGSMSLLGPRPQLRSDLSWADSLEPDQLCC